MRQSAAYETVSTNNGKIDTELAALVAEATLASAIPERLDLQRGIQALTAFLAPPTTDQAVWMNRIGRQVVALHGGGWAPSQRTDYLETVNFMLCGFPYALVESVLEDVVRRCKFSGSLVAMVLERIEDRWMELKAEVQIANRALRLLAGGGDGE